MKIHALDIPDDETALARWLEEYLVGFQLSELVAELQGVQGVSRAESTLEHILGDYQEQVLKDGLASLPAELVRRLLREPALLLDLQELIHVQGGCLWTDRMTLIPPFDHILEQGRSKLESLLGRSASKSQTEPNPVPLRPHIAWQRRPWVVSLVTAAAMLAGVVLYHRLATPVVEQKGAASWGWNRPEALPQDVSAARYLNHLADGASEWFNKRPESAVEVARRIAEFRQGCSALLLTKHEPLTPEDKAWLVARCRSWAERLDKHLGAVESGVDPLTVRGETDQTITQLVQALRIRAGEAGQRAI
jgi:hypothetical protein